MTPLIRKARPDEAAAMGRIVAAAFFDLEVSRWLVPDDDRRREILPVHFGLFTEHVAKHGVMYTTNDHAGVAAWLPSAGVPDIPDFDERNGAACGERVEFFDLLGACFDKFHPHDEAHYYLQFLAVRPGMQGRGLGSALMAPHHAMADEHGMPAYLEASNERSRNLYLRHGYEDRGDPIHATADAPPLFPMWRVAGR